MNIALADLKPVLIRYDERPDGTFHVPVRKWRNAQGVRFLCPMCFLANGGPVGTHVVICWSRSRGTPEHAKPGPGRWTLEGGSLDRLTLGPEPGQTRSVQLLGGCAWHGFVTDGRVT